MAITINAEHGVSRGDVFTLDPRDIVVDWRKNLARNGEEPPIDEALIELARDMAPRRGAGDAADGTSGQLNPVMVRLLPDRRVELIGGFRRTRAAFWLVESGECPDFRLKCIVTKCSDVEAALANLSENLQREDPRPIQIAHAIRCLTEDYGLSIEVVAGRLKRSAQRIRQLLDLVTLPGPVQASVERGETSVAAALELTGLPISQQIEIFSEAKDSNGHVKAGDVKAVKRARREVAVEKGETTTVKAATRSLREVKAFLESLTGPGESKACKKLAVMTLGFIAGETTENQMTDSWRKIAKD